jgi:ribonuclease HI
MILRGARVLARSNEAGEPIAGTDGRVEVRYKPGDPRSYRAAKRNLEAIEGEALLADDACPPAMPAAQNPTQKKAAAAKRFQERTQPVDAIIVYADGACSGNPGPAGIGVVLQDGASRKELSQFLGPGTNNIAELMAIYEAVQAIEAVERPVRLHTDSRYSIGVLSMGWKAKANQELVARVRQALSRLKDVELIHVPGHAGVVLNERADVLAVQAVKTESSTGWISYDDARISSS